MVGLLGMRTGIPEGSVPVGMVSGSMGVTMGVVVSVGTTIASIGSGSAPVEGVIRDGIRSNIGRNCLRVRMDGPHLRECDSRNVLKSGTM